jgi:pyruvate-formate lyase-activating enzyme
LEISKQLKDEIWDYCRANNITNIDEFTMKILRQGFTVEKFGATPQTVEKVVEKVVEVPVEKIVEKIVEVKVEVPVEKEVYITDNSNNEELANKIKDLETERDKYKEESKDFEQKWNDTLEKLREELKKKNKRDLYGE